MLKRKKKVIAKVMATTMLASTLAMTFAPGASALEARATVSSSTLAGNDRYETAVKVSESGWSSATNAVIINGDRGLVDALTATPYASLKNAPILVTEKNKLTSATKTRLTKLGVKNVDIVGGEAVVSKAVENELKAMGLTVKRINGDDRYKTAVKVAEEINKISSVSKIAVVNGDKGLPDAVSIAAPAVDNKMPILLSDPNHGINESKGFLNGKSISKSYVIGQTGAVSDSVMNSLPGSKSRLGGTDRHDTNAKVIKEFYTSSNLDNVYVAKSGYVKNNEELVDALAVGVLAAKNDDPVLIVGKTLGDTQKTLLRDKSFTKITQVGNGIPSASIEGIKDSQKDPESKVSSVSLVDYKTVKLRGEELNRISASNISMSGNSVSSYNANSSGTEAIVVFNNSFKNGTNTITVKSNLGTSTNHTFTYGAAVSSVEATTKEVGLSGTQYLGFTVNGGQVKSISELNALGWTVKFSSSKNVFYNEKDPTEPLRTSTTGKLKTSGFTKGEIFDYEVILTNGSQTIKTSDKKLVTVTDTATNLASIKSYKLTFTNRGSENNTLNSNKMLTGEIISLSDIKGNKNNGEETNIATKDVVVTSSNPTVLSVSGTDITARKVGSATITVKSGSVSKTSTIQVLSGVDNTRSVSSVRFYELDTSNQKTSIRLTKSGNPLDLTVRATDQYGDPINSGITIDGAISTTGSSAQRVATTKVTAFANGKAKLTLTPLNYAGTATLRITKTVGGTTTTLGSLSVTVAEATSSQTYSLDRVAGSKDLKLDRYEYKNDSTITLQLNNYDSNGSLKPQIDISDENEYVIKGYDTNLVTVTRGAKNSGQITVVPTRGKTKTGSTTISLYKKDGTREIFIKSISITIEDTTPVIESVSIKTLPTITSINESKSEFKLLDLFTLGYTKIADPASGVDVNVQDENQYKKVVEGIKVKGYPNQEVLMSITNGSEGNGNAILFIDRGDKDGKYDSDDFILATLKIELSTVKGIIANGTVKLDSKTPDGSIIVGLYDGVYSATKSPKDTKIDVKIPR